MNKNNEYLEKLVNEKSLSGLVSYDFDTFQSSMKPTMHQLTIFDVKELPSGLYIYRRKKIDKDCE